MITNKKKYNIEFCDDIKLRTVLSCRNEMERKNINKNYLSSKYF